MIPYEEKRISVHDAIVGMELSTDAMTPTGQLLVPKDTTITENHLFRMNLYQILSVVVKVYKDDFTTKTLVETKESLDPDAKASYESSIPRLMQDEQYKRYTKVYEKISPVVKEQFDLLIKGNTFDTSVLLQSTNALMKSVRLKSDLFTYMSNMKSLSEHTYVHSMNCAILCKIFAGWLKFDEEKADQLTLAGLVHDIGKTLIEPSLLDKPGKLSEDEFNLLKSHATKGYEAVKKLPLSDPVKQAILLHHERNDGSGYPLGLKGDQIPEFAKIMAIVDVYDAMTSNRSYHRKFSPFKVIQIFEQESYGYLDTKYLFIFLENIAHYYLGEQVRLNDGREGKIVFIHNQTPSRPIIQVAEDLIDLKTTFGLSIEELL